MLLSKDTCVIGRENNVVLVDFTRKPEPPDPRFPGANALRNNATAEPIGSRPSGIGGDNLKGVNVDERCSTFYGFAEQCIKMGAGCTLNPSTSRINEYGHVAKFGPTYEMGQTATPLSEAG
jgi:hypothetical protein